MFRKLRKAKAKEQEPDIPYKHCLNCNTELQGNYCHICGQQAINPKPSVRDFIMEYLDNAYMWDPRLIRTLWVLVKQPGVLTNKFLAGKIRPYIHPLRLNMFILFIFLSLFLFFSGTEKVNNSMHNITNELVSPNVQMQILLDDKESVEKMNASPRDTVRLYAPLYLATAYPNFISELEVIEDTNGQSLDKWIAIVPHSLIEDNIIVQESNGYYTFKCETEEQKEMMDVFYSVLEQIVDIITTYLPIIVLLTAPFLALSLHIIQRKRRVPKMNHLIFSLHYTAFIELLITFIYILFLVIRPPMWLLQYTMIAGSCSYLAVAFRRVYETKSWFGAISKSVLTSLIYLLICLQILVVIFFIACIVVANTL